MKIANKDLVRLFSHIYKYKAWYWWFRYRCNNIYNNFLADYFPNFWRAERKNF